MYQAHLLPAGFYEKLTMNEKSTLSAKLLTFEEENHLHGASTAPEAELFWSKKSMGLGCIRNPATHSHSEEPEKI